MLRPIGVCREISLLSDPLLNTSSDPGYVYVCDFSDQPERRISVLRNKSWHPSPPTLPNQVVPQGLSLER